MAQRVEEATTSSPKQRWLRYEIARLVTLRNLSIAGITAAGTCGVVVSVLLALRPDSATPAAIAKPTAGTANAQEQPTGNIGYMRPPTQIFAPDSVAPSTADTASNTEQTHYGVNGEKLIPITDEIRQKLSKFLVKSGVLDGFDLYDVQAASGHSMANVVSVEQGPTWEHAIAIMPKGRLLHMYTFEYACGHRASTTPDPYRDLMYADPQRVADRYAKLLCDDCRSMREHLDTKKKAAPQGGK